MVSVQDLREFVVGLVNLASKDVKAAEDLYGMGFLNQALYYIEQGSEKTVKALFFSPCLCFQGFSNRDVSTCYSEIAVDRKGNVVEDPDDFVRNVRHDPLKLFKHLLFIEPRMFASIYQKFHNIEIDKKLVLDITSAIYRDLGIESSLPESPREISDLGPEYIIKLLLELASYISALFPACSSEVLKSSRLCESVKRLDEEARKCEEAKNEDICLNLVNTMSEVFRSLSSLMLVKDVWRSLKLEELLETPYIDDFLKSFEGFISRLKEELAKRTDPTTYRKTAKFIEQNIKPMVKCAITVAKLFVITYTLFYLASPFYNLVRYPVSSKKLDICRDESLRRIKKVENLCNKSFISSEDVVAGETSIEEFIKIAVEALKETVSNLKQMLNSIKTKQPM
ncbi:MAG: hypothetical protein QXN53_08845 [Thermoproteota archaeon]